MADYLPGFEGCPSAEIRDEHECWTPMETIGIALEIVRGKRGIAWALLDEMLSDGRLVECPEHAGRYADKRA